MNSREETLRRRREADKLRREERKANHICIRCGKNPTIDKSMCDVCRDKMAIYRNETRKFNKEHNICTMCRHEIVYDGFSTCEMCRDKQKQYSAKFYSKETEVKRKERKRKQAEYMRDKRAKRKEQGVCVECGKKLCANSQIHCIEHYIANKNNYTPVEIPREERVAYGLCYTCGNEIENTQYKLCNCCLDRVRSLDRTNGARAISQVWKQYYGFPVRKVANN